LGGRRSLAKIAKIARVRKSEFEIPDLLFVFLGVLARDFPVPVPLRCYVMDWVPLGPAV